MTSESQRNWGPPRITAQGASTEAETESAPEGKPDDSKLPPDQYRLPKLGRAWRQRTATMTNLR